MDRYTVNGRVETRGNVVIAVRLDCFSETKHVSPLYDLWILVLTKITFGLEI